ncbi:MAG: ribose-phosphate diphosphokinase [Spirochaetaceae bacterium]|jgi:ribose-phosphate pyrophosphokinase|nr:ribose-phosphate diphosphokinase [Spirochaetaceae bacterium]
MSFSKPTTLGIIACPGGDKFADSIIAHLKTIYSRRFDKKASGIAKLYGLDKEEAVRQLNLSNDLNGHRIKTIGDGKSYRVPSFKIPCKFTKFANGEFKTEILNSVRGKDIFIVQDVENRALLTFPGSAQGQTLSINDHILNLFVTIDAVIQCGARCVTLVMPAYPYARQHKKKGREGLTASSLGRIFENMGVHRIITLDLHSKEIEHTFSSLHLENMHASYQILRKLNAHFNLNSEDLVVVSPDTGAIDRNKYFANSLQKPLALLYKERDYSKVTTSAHDSNIVSARLLGDVKGKTVFIADDMLGTGGTLIKAMKLIKEMGAEKIVCAISLPLFTGNAIEHFDKAYKDGLFDYIIGTNAVSAPDDLQKRSWYLNANVSNLFARVISRLHHNRSLSPLLDNNKMIQRMLSSRRS